MSGLGYLTPMTQLMDTAEKFSVVDWGGEHPAKTYGCFLLFPHMLLNIDLQSESQKSKKTLSPRFWLVLDSLFLFCGRPYPYSYGTAYVNKSFRRILGIKDTSDVSEDNNSL